MKKAEGAETGITEAASLWRGGCRRSRVRSFYFLLLTFDFLFPGKVLAAQMPSLFRGLVVTDSPVGVRVVSVEAGSQPAMADLRPEDIVISIHGEDVHSIDEFAVVSNALKGRVQETTVVVFRGGTPRQIALHVYSYPLMRAWGIRFVPNSEIVFAQPGPALDYWTRLGRAYRDVGRPGDALDAYLNALHVVPSNTEVAMAVSELSWAVGRQAIEDRRMPAAVTALEQAVTVMQRLFDHPLTDAQLLALKSQLETTLQTLQRLSRESQSS